MKRTQGAMGGTGGAANALAGTIMKLAGPAAIAALAYKAVTHAINEVGAAMTRIDETAATASNLGIQIDKFVAYQHAAKKAEVGSGEFEVAIKKMENAAADAAEGTGNAAKHFERLGISAEKFKALSPDQQLAVMADKLQGVTNQADRAAIATDLFGRSGLGMLNFLKDGSAGLAEAEARAKMLGITLTDIDAAKVDAANDAMDDLAGVFDGIWNQLAVALAPAIQAVAEGITAFFTDNMDTIKDWVSWFGKLAGAAVDVAKVFWEIGTALAKMTAPYWVIKAISWMIGGGKGTELGGMKQSTATLPDVSKGPNDPLTKALKAEGLKVFEATRTPMEEFAKKQEDLNRLLGVGAINQETYNRAMKAAQADLDKANEFKFDQPRVELKEPRMGNVASSPAALQRGTSEAFNQFLANQQNKEGDPVRELMKKQHDEEMAKLDAIRETLRQHGAKGAIF